MSLLGPCFKEKMRLMSKIRCQDGKNSCKIENHVNPLELLRFFVKITPLVPVYSLTLLLSAALLFSVQPMFSKMVLPLLGGTPQVWNTAMLFFQLMLLGGYAYAHGTTRFLSIRAQAVLHITLLAVFTLVLPILIPPGTTPPTQTDPTLWQLGLMITTVGGPFFVLAGSAPMLQRWFSASGHKDSDNPYFLYGASNLGSMTALLAYPVLIEPFLNLAGQSHSWMIGYFALIALTAVSIVTIWNNPAAKHAPKAVNDGLISPITWPMRIKWLVLAFIPSSLMLGVTTYITADIASVPLLWILPLALYVGTFIIVFARTQIISLKTTTTIQAVLLVVLLAQKIAFSLVSPYLLIGIHMAVFFFSALTCHMELAKSRPNARHLTEFYLIMSIGGAIGGFFNAIIAPQYLVVPIEYGLALVLACFIRYSSEPEAAFTASLEKVTASIRKNKLDAIASPRFIVALVTVLATLAAFNNPSRDFLPVAAAAIALGLAFIMDRRWLFASLVGFALLFFPLGYHWDSKLYDKIIHHDRNFFGPLKIFDSTTGVRVFMSGITNHGTQALDEKWRLTPLSYYSTSSPLQDAVHILDKGPFPQKVGVVGLGIGVIACFEHKGRSYDFFEINPLVRDIAENQDYFTYLKDCGSQYEIILGDGRMMMKEQSDGGYDAIVIDAFTSDNIPAHLVTLEALELYFRKLKENGMLIVHISNNHVDLEPVLQKASEKMGIPALARIGLAEKIKGTDYKSDGSHWVVLSRNPQVIETLEKDGWTPAMARAGVNLWTDDYSNLFMTLGNKSIAARLEKLKAERKAEKAE